MAGWFGKAKWLFRGLVDGYLDDCHRAIAELDSLVVSFGPFVDGGIYNDIQELLRISRRFYIIARSLKEKDTLEPDTSAPSKFAEVRQHLFKSIADRIKELSQYDHSTEPTDK
jgi:hypothetical protein